MKLTKILATVLCLAAVATACQQPVEEPMNEKGRAINLAVDVDNYTKATDTAFEEGDQIGLHIVIPEGTFLENAKYSYTEGGLVGEKTNYWHKNESVLADLYAYYPYSATGAYKAAGYTFTVNADQNRAGAFTASDLMVAHTTSKPTSEVVELPFRHALSKIVIKIDNQLEEIVDGESRKMEIKDVYFSDVYGTATVRFNEVGSTVSGSKGTIKTANVTIDGEQAYALIVVPQEDVTPKLIVTTTNDKQFTYQLKDKISFSAGKVSTAEITISDKSISTAFTPTISDWVGDNDLQFGQGEEYEGGNEGGNDEGGNKIYLHPGIWESADGQWFAAYFFDGSGSEAKATMTDNDGDGVYECAVPAGMGNVIFCRMNPQWTEFAWNKWENDQMTEQHVYNQTDDLTVGVAPTNHYYITSWDGGAEGKSGGEWNTDGYVVVVPETSGLGVVGSFAASNWESDINLVKTETSDLLVAKGIQFKAYDAFKIRTAGNWNGGVNLGTGDVNYYTHNKYFTAVDNGADISVAEAGTYDIYYNTNTKRIYIMTAGTDISAATEQTSNGPQPDASTMSWGLAGVHNNWGAPDTKLEWDGTIGLYVARNARLEGEFKVRADESWSTNFGSGEVIQLNSDTPTTLYNNNSNNCSINAGNYDVYFWCDATNLKANAKLWVRSVGSAAPKL